MKVKTIRLFKFKRLQRKLGLGLRETIGTLELLWLAAVENTPRGDIGSLTNEEIAIACDWPGEPDALVSALYETEWVDEGSEGERLVIHDWEDHCPTYVKGNLQSRGLSMCKSIDRTTSSCFISEQFSDAISEPLKHPAIAPRSEPPAIKSSLVKSSQVSIDSGVDVGPRKQDFERVYKKYPRKVGKKLGMEKLGRFVKTWEVFERFEKCVDHMASAYSHCPQNARHFSTFVNQETWNDDDWPVPIDTPSQQKTQENHRDVPCYDFRSGKRVVIRE